MEGGKADCKFYFIREHEILGPGKVYNYYGGGYYHTTLNREIASRKKWVWGMDIFFMFYLCAPSQQLDFSCIDSGQF